MSDDKKKNPRGVYEKNPGSGVWYVRFKDENGRLHREGVGSKSLAEKVYHIRKAEVAKRRFIPEATQHTFGSLVDDAVRLLKTQHRGKYGDKPCKLGRFAIVREWWGQRSASSLTASDISDKLGEHCKTPATRNRYRAVVSRVYSLAVKNGKALRNPARGVDLLEENNERTRQLEANEETILRKAMRKLCPEREPEFDLALNSGMRWEEQYTLTWDRVDLKYNQLTINRSKHGKRRFVELNAAAVSALKQLRILHPESALVCPDGEEHRYWWDAVRAEAKLDEYFRWHDLRHTFASRLVRRGVSLYAISELLGHKTLVMTKRYAHLDRADLRKAVAQLVQPGIPTGIPAELDADTPTSGTIN